MTTPTDPCEAAGTTGASAHPVHTRDAADLVAAEQARIRARPGRAADRATVLGLALSGGGIRSASFALGVLHALVRARVLRHVDYLSTVSGGGYTGTALTWMLSTFGGAGVDPASFPLSSPQEGAVGVAGNPPPSPRAPLRALDWIRRRGRYLTPDARLDLASALGVVLRGTTTSLFVVFTLLLAVLVAVRLLSQALGSVLPEVGSLDAFPIARPEDLAYWTAWVWASVVLTGVFVLGSLLFACTTRWRPPPPRSSYALRRGAQIGLGRVLKGLALTLVLASLPAVADRLAGVTVQSAFSFATVGGGAAIARFLLSRRSGGEPRGALQAALSVVAAVALGYGLLLLVWVVSGRILTVSPAWVGVAIAAALGLLGLLVGLVTNANYTSPHRMYRDRLMEAFMPRAERVAQGRAAGPDGPGPSGGADPTAPDPDGALLSEMGLLGRTAKGEPTAYPGPYPLVNTTMVVAASPDPSLHDRGGESFLLSPLYCGSSVTGWRRTDRYVFRRGHDRSSTMTLATAMAISGAAANPHTGAGGRGVTRNRAIGLVMGLLNIRLGYFEIHPDGRRRAKIGPARPNHIWPGLAEVLGSGAREDGHFVELSDGGHFENLGLYELLRRRVDLILCCDGGADPDFAFGDLAVLIERARVDFGVNVDFVPGFEHDRLAVRRPGDEQDERPEHASPGFALARISYPEKGARTSEPGARSEKVGLLVILKSTMIAGLPADLVAYRSAHPRFPHETTADQFFDEAQFEAYRELGYRLGRHALDNPVVRSLLGLDEAGGGEIATPERIAALASPGPVPAHEEAGDER